MVKAVGLGDNGTEDVLLDVSDFSSIFVCDHFLADFRKSPTISTKKYTHAGTVIYC